MKRKYGKIKKRYLFFKFKIYEYDWELIALLCGGTYTPSSELKHEKTSTFDKIKNKLTLKK